MKKTKPSIVAWDSCVILDAVQPNAPRHTQVEPFIRDGEAGLLHISVSEVSIIECSHLKAEPGISLADQQQLLDKWFEGPMIVRRTITQKITKKAIELTRKYPALKAIDAIVMATALCCNAPVLHTHDPKLLALSKKEGNPPLVIEPPIHAQGTLFQKKTP